MKAFPSFAVAATRLASPTRTFSLGISLFAVQALAAVQGESPGDYDQMREHCLGAGGDIAATCQAGRGNSAVLRSCKEHQERTIRMCMLGVMERQNRDIHGLPSETAQPVPLVTPPAVTPNNDKDSTQ